MDADTRHQLRQNELAETLLRLRSWDNPSTRYALLAVVAVLLIVGGWKAWSYSRAAAVERDWRSLTSVNESLLMGADAATAQGELQSLINGGANEAVQCYARLALAQTRIQQALEDPEQREAGLTEARTLLQEVVSDGGASGALRAAASYGLATVKEWDHDYAGARELYQSVVDNAAHYAGSPWVQMSQDRLLDIDELEAEVVFAAGAPPTAGAATGAKRDIPFEVPEGVQVRPMDGPPPGVTPPAGAQPTAQRREPPPGIERLEVPGLKEQMREMIEARERQRAEEQAQKEAEAGEPTEKPAEQPADNSADEPAEEPAAEPAGTQ